MGALSLIGLTAGAGPLLAACSAPPTPQPAAPTAAAKPAEAANPPVAPKPTEAAAKPAAAAPAAGAPAVEVRLHVRTGNEADTLADRLPDFEKQFPGIKVKIESFPGAEYFTKVQTLIAGGQLGDVAWAIVHQGWGPFFLASGVTMSLDSLVDGEKFDLTQYYPVCVKACRVFEGKLLGLPFKLQPFHVGLYYNANQFKEEKVDPPTLDTTLDQLVEMSRKMTKTSPDGRPTRFGFLPAVIGAAYEPLVPVTRTFGSDVFSADGKKALLNTPESIAGMKWVLDMVFQQKVSPSVKQLTSDGQDSMFVAGVGTMFQSGSWTKSVQTRVKDKFEVKNTLMPVGPGKSRGSMAGVDVMMINAKSKVVKESWELTKMLTDKETGIRLGEGRGGASGTSGGRPDAFNDPRLMSNPLHPIWIKAVEESGPLYVAANFRGGEIDTVLKQKLGALYLGDEKPTQQFFDDLNSAVQQILDKPRN